MQEQRKQTMIEGFLGVVLGLVVSLVVCIVCAVAYNNADTPAEFTSNTTAEIVYSTPIPSPSVSTTETPELTTSPEEVVETADPIFGVGDPNNEVYPYSMMGTNWGAEIYEQGFKYYEIPSSYKMAGGMFPEVAQVYLWCICKEAGVDYYIALALIERESGYKYDAVGDNGDAKGLMQLQEKWHKDRMEALGVTDLYNPYENMRVAVSFLKEIQDRYLANSGAHCVLMVYNMGATGANKLWAENVYSTTYTKYILQRAQEIKQELQDQ